MKKYKRLFILFFIFILTCGCGVKYQFNKAQKREIKGEYAEAIEGYKKILQKYPNKKESVESVFRIATIYYEKLNDLESALSYYRVFLEKSNNTDVRIPDVKLKIAEIEFDKTKDILLYKEKLEEIIKDHFDSEYAIIVQQKLNEVNKLEEELKSCKKEAAEFFKKGDYKSAADNYKKWLIYFPNDKEVLSKLEETESKLKEIQSAQKFKELSYKAIDIRSKKYYWICEKPIPLCEYIYLSLLKTEEYYIDEFEEREAKKKIEKSYKDAEKIIEEKIFYTKIKIDGEDLSATYDFDSKCLNVSFKFNSFDSEEYKTTVVYFDPPVNFNISLKMEESTAREFKHKLLNKGIECYIIFRIRGIRRNPQIDAAREFKETIINMLGGWDRGFDWHISRIPEYALDSEFICGKANLLGQIFYF